MHNQGIYHLPGVGLIGFFIGIIAWVSETKLKLRALKYGILPDEFERLKKGGTIKVKITGPRGGVRPPMVIRGLQGVQLIVNEGRKNDLINNHQEALIRRSNAETRNIASSTASRYARIARQK